ncbi:MAG TPA: MBOAT family protein, partial [Acidimicrobiales bacterium]|nr:MBOAT family protein [Acidimicrobiales bacterium]
MLFPTVRFAVFYCLVLPANWLLMPRPLRWRLFVLGASFVFYAGWDWRYTGLLAASILVNQVGANGIHRAAPHRRTRWLVAVLAVDLGLLAAYKYAGFLADNATSLFDLVGLDWRLTAPGWVLPVGISFFTFQAISYVVDVHRRQLPPVGLLDFAVYLSFFPHLVAGPIVRAAEFLPQLRGRRDPKQVETSLGLWLIAVGLFKKVVVASYLAEEIVDPLFAFPGQHGGVEALVGVYAYAIQIYADFSGYTDMAIGLALLLGFRFPQNFDRPYSATSLQDFWRRWHMTLSRWLRDYLYIPLGGNQGGPTWRHLTLLLTMVLGGLWHGAAWHFVLWGAIHGAGLALERRWSERGGRAGGSLDPVEAAPGPGYGEVLVAEPVTVRRAAAPVRRPWRRRLVTFHVVCLAWVFFRAGSVGGAFDVLGRIAGGDAVNKVPD